MEEGQDQLYVSYRSSHMKRPRLKLSDVSIGHSCHHRLSALRPLFSPVHECFVLIAFRVNRRRSLSTFLLNWDPRLHKANNPLSRLIGCPLPELASSFFCNSEVRSLSSNVRFQLSKVQSMGPEIMIWYETRPEKVFSCSSRLTELAGRRSDFDGSSTCPPL